MSVEPERAVTEAAVERGELLGRRLREVLVARYGPEVGGEAWQDAVAYGWQHRERLAAMANPIGYLYRVAQTSVRRQHRWRRTVALPIVELGRIPDVEPKLAPALARLSAHQRVAVLLVHAYGWTLQEVADVLEVDKSTVRNHVARALTRLRREVGDPRA
jgi:DNA-directed RNA polymerase specialized sigma24 family protein